MKRPAWWLACLLSLAVLAACGRLLARSDRSFDEIRDLVAGKTPVEVTALLGEPDSRQNILSDNQRWVWWNYTYLGGNQYPPEMRDRVVHLEITFARSAPVQGAVAGIWKVSSPFGVSYSFPGNG